MVKHLNIEMISYIENDDKVDDIKIFTQPLRKKYAIKIISIFIVIFFILAITNIIINYNIVGKYNALNYNMGLNAVLFAYGVWFFPYFIFFLIPGYVVLYENKKSMLSENVDIKSLIIGMITITLYMLLCTYRIFLYIILVLTFDKKSFGNVISVMTLLCFSIETILNVLFSSSSLYTMCKLMHDFIRK